jgi:predicted RNA-binding protein with PUA-like domain
MARRAWLMKTEPDTFGIDDLRRKKREPWSGVRNFQARNFMREMALGDDVLFYHSNAKPPGVAGLARICRLAYPDFTAWDEKSEYFDPKSTPEAPRWFMVDVAFVERFPSFLSLDELRTVPALGGMVLLKRSRLSVQPVGAAEYALICKLGRRGRK